MIKRVWANSILTRTALYKSITKQENLVYEHLSSEENLDKALQKYLKARLKNEFIAHYLNDLNFKKAFSSIFKLHVQVFNLNGNTLIKFGKNNKSAMILCLAEDVVTKDNVLKVGLHAFSSQINKLPSEFKEYESIRITNLVSIIKRDEYYQQQLFKMIKAEHLSDGKMLRLSNGWNNSTEYNKGLNRFIFSLFKKYIVSPRFTHQDYSILQAFNSKVWTGYSKDSQLSIINFILVAKNVPFLADRLYQFKTFIPNAYHLIAQSIEKEEFLSLTQIKDNAFLSKILSSDFNSLNYHFTARHTHFLMSLNSAELRYILYLNNGFVGPNFAAFLGVFKTLKQEQIPKNYFELCFLVNVIHLGCKIPNNLSLFVKPYYEAALTDAKGKGESLYHFVKGRKIPFVTKKGQLSKKSCESTVNELFRNVDDYLRHLNGTIESIMEESFSYRNTRLDCGIEVREQAFIDNILSRNLPHYSLKQLVIESNIYHERVQDIEGRFIEAIADFDLANSIVRVDLSRFTFKAPKLLNADKIDGISITQLRTEEVLRNESQYMRHCVGVYASSVLNGSAIIFHIGDYTEESSASMKNESTLEIRFNTINKKFMVEQHQTYSNQKYQRVTEEHHRIAELICSKLNQKYQKHWEKDKIKSKLSREALYEFVIPKTNEPLKCISAAGFEKIYAPVSGLKLAHSIASQINDYLAKENAQ